MKYIFPIVLSLSLYSSPGITRDTTVTRFVKADAITNFWNWFVRNQERLRQFESDPDKYLSEFLEQVQKITPGLAIELEPAKNGIINMTVSADGNIELFEQVRQIVAKAPVVKGWKIIAFRQRVPFADLHNMEIKAGGVHLDPQQMKFLPVIEHGLLNIILYVDGVNDNNYNQVAYAGLLLMDNVLGEYDCVTRVHSYDFRPLPVKTETGPTPRPLAELPAFVDEFHRKK